MPKAMLTHYLCALPPAKIAEFDSALAVALGLE
jgi:hypothetical protein